MGTYCMQVKALDKQTFAYDFRETSSSSHVSVVKKVNKADFAATGFDYQGIPPHLCSADDVPQITTYQCLTGRAYPCCGV